VTAARDETTAVLPASQVILKGEDEAQYHRILEEVTRSVRPADIIEHFWVRDVTDLLWEALRLRRLKGSLLHAATRQGLTKVLDPLVGFMKVKALADGWFGGKQWAKQEVDQLLKEAGLSFDIVIAEGLAAKLNDIERIDRMIASAEARRNAVLREISRHRDAVAARLARASEAIEEAEFAEVDPSDSQKAGPDGQQP
jgi:hypothetical protein